MFDNEFFNNYQLVSAAAVPIILALVQVVKITEWVATKYIPLLSIGIGVGVAMLLNTYQETISSDILMGVMLGLAASGLYSGISTTQRAVLQAKREKALQKVKDKR